MNRADRRRLPLIEKLYDRIPAVSCKGLCVEACGAIPMSALEFQRIEEATGAPPSVTEEGRCTLLVAGRCTVYDARPMICRLYGASARMPCPHGCATKVLSEPKARDLLALATAIGGVSVLDEAAEAFLLAVTGQNPVPPEATAKIHRLTVGSLTVEVRPRRAPQGKPEP